MSSTVQWLCVAAMVLGIAACQYGITTESGRRLLEREMACWDRGGNWEPTGWTGAWCEMTPVEASKGESE